MDRCPIHTLSFPFLNRKGFPQPGRIRPLDGHFLPPGHQVFEQRESEERARESEWIPPSVQAEPQIRLTVKPISPEAPWGQNPATFAGKVPRFNRDTDKREMPMSYGFARACRSPMASCCAPRLASFFLFFKTRFCRIWLADAWHIGMSRKGTCILSYPSLFLSGRIRRAGKSHVRKFATISLLDPWHFSTLFMHKWVLSYPDAFGVGITRASPG